MKYLTIILLCLATTLQGQWYKSEAFKTITLYSTSIILSGIGDGLNDSGHKPLGHAMNATSTGLLVASPFILNVEKGTWGWYAASYISLRIALFDMSYNTARGLPIGYVGNSSIYDKVLQKAKAPPALINGFRAFYFTVGIAIPINEL